VRRREGGREGEVVLRVWVNAVATEGMLGDLNPLGDGPCRSLADDGARVPEVLPAAIVGGLYSITALRKTGAEDEVYSRHQELKQASRQAIATTKTRVASRYGSSRQILHLRRVRMRPKGPRQGQCPPGPREGPPSRPGSTCCAGGG